MRAYRRSMSLVAAQPRTNPKEKRNLSQIKAEASSARRRRPRTTINVHRITWLGFGAGVMGYSPFFK